MSGRRVLLWAVLALVFSSLCLGRFLLAPAVWLAPVFLVRFVRKANARLALPGFVVLHTAALEIAFRGTVPLPAAAHIALFTALSLALGLVFMADRWLALRFSTFATTFVLPCGWAAYDFLTGRFSPNGSWGSIAYGLTEQWPIAQLASVGGWVSLTFVVAWFATVVNRIWEASESGRPVRRDGFVLATVLAALVAFGMVRPSMHDNGPTIRVALLSGPDTFQGPHLEEVWEYTRGVKITPERVADAREQIATWRTRHLAMVEDALAAGAKIATWAEVNAAFTREEEAEWLAAFGEAARRHGAFVGLGLAVFAAEPGAPTENRFVLLGPDGERVWDYLKATRVPGDHNVEGDGKLPRADTDLARLSGAICFDMDFPHLIGQAGAMDADVLIAPSNDWTEARRIHARMAVMRSIEQGFHLVRPTKDGISLVSDAYGRVLSRLDTDRGPETVLLADVPSRGVVTVYSRSGDAFGWSACAGFMLSLIFGMVVRREAAAELVTRSA